MNYFDLAVAKKLAGGSGGGGGSSDFSTATMTVLPNDETMALELSAPVKDNDASAYGAYVTGGSTVEILLYKNSAYVLLSANVASVSGAIEDVEHGEYLVTGDCTVTLS